MSFRKLQQERIHRLSAMYHLLTKIRLRRQTLLPVEEHPVFAGRVAGVMVTTVAPTMRGALIVVTIGWQLAVVFTR